MTVVVVVVVVVVRRRSGPTVVVFGQALVEVKILEHLRERDLESTSNVPLGFGREGAARCRFGGKKGAVPVMIVDGRDCFLGIAYRDVIVFYELQRSCHVEVMLN